MKVLMKPIATVALQTVPRRQERKPSKEKIRGKIETIQTILQLRWNRMLRRFMRRLVVTWIPFNFRQLKLMQKLAQKTADSIVKIKESDKLYKYLDIINPHQMHLYIYTHVRTCTHT